MPGRLVEIEKGHFVRATEDLAMELAFLIRILGLLPSSRAGSIAPALAADPVPALVETPMYEQDVAAGSSCRQWRSACRRCPPWST